MPGRPCVIDQLQINGTFEQRTERRLRFGLGKMPPQTVVRPDREAKLPL